MLQGYGEDPDHVQGRKEEEEEEEEDGEDLFCKALGVPGSRSPSGCVAAQEVP